MFVQDHVSLWQFARHTHSINNKWRQSSLRDRLRYSTVKCSRLHQPMVCSMTTFIWFIFTFLHLSLRNGHSRQEEQRDCQNPFWYSERQCKIWLSPASDMCPHLYQDTNARQFIVGEAANTMKDHKSLLDKLGKAQSTVDTVIKIGGAIAEVRILVWSSRVWLNKKSPISVASSSENGSWFDWPCIWCKPYP